MGSERNDTGSAPDVSMVMRTDGTVIAKMPGLEALNGREIETDELDCEAETSGSPIEIDGANIARVNASAATAAMATSAETAMRALSSLLDQPPIGIIIRF